MAVGMVPVHVPFAPRPIPGELCSSWVHRVAAANVLTVEELFEALRAHANDTLIGGLDYALAPATCASLAAWCRIPESMLRASDLQRAFPEASLDWFSQYTGDHALERFITPVLRPGFCAVCLGQQLHAGVATHVPAEWALACLTHRPHHRALLLSSCASCFRPDPLDLSLATTHRVPRCRFCDTALPLFVEREHDPAAVLFPLQRTILACLRGQPPSMNVVGPCTARTFVQLIADLVALVTARDAADTLVLADLLPNPANWSGRALRWRAHHRFATAPLADRQVVLGAVSTLLAHRDALRHPRRDDPFALLWPALSTAQQHTLLTTTRRWPAAIRARVQHVARLPARPPRSRSRFEGSRVHSMTSVRSTQ
jgi:hypothetical protein